MTRTALLMLVSFSLLTACVTIDTGQSVVGSGQVTSETRQVEGASAVELAMQGALTIEIGDTPGLVIEAEENLLPYIQTEVQMGTLTIRNERGINLQPTREIRFHLTITSLEGLATSSSGTIQAPQVTAVRFRVDISSSGDIDLAGLVAEDLTVDISSNGTLRIDTGSVETQSITLSSSGNYDGAEVKCNRADVTLSSSGDAMLWVLENLIARLSSSGNVRVYGHPLISEDTSSSGKVIPLGDK